MVNGQQQAFALGTVGQGGDDYTLNALALQIQVGAPIIEATKNVDGVLSVTKNVGDIVHFTFQLSNIGTDTALNVVFKDTLQDGLVYVDGSFEVDSSPVIPSIVGQTISYNIGSLMMPPSPAVVIEFDALITKFPETCNFIDQAFIDYEFFSCPINQMMSGSASTNPVTIVIPPLANPNTGMTPLNVVLNGNSVLINDLGHGLTVINFMSPTTEGGMVVVNPDGTYVYTPPLNFVGTDTFTYTLQDCNGNLASATAAISIVPLAPINFCGRIEKCTFLTGTKYFLTATFPPSISPNVTEVSLNNSDLGAPFISPIVSYRVYLNEKIIAIIPADGLLQFKTPLLSRSVGSHYSVTAVNSLGLESFHKKIRIIK